MPDPSPLAIAKAFAAAVAALPGFKAALHYEPEELPSLPCVTMNQRRVEQRDRFTGPSTENVWTWAVYVHVPLGGRVAGSDFQQAQEALYALVPAVLGVQRADPSIGGNAIRSEILDLGEEPEPDVDQREVVKILELRATTEET